MNTKESSAILSLKPRAIAVQEVLQDSRSDPIATALWWTEYLLPGQIKSHLISPLQNQSWIQRRHLDAYAFLFLLIVISVIIAIRIPALILSFAMTL